MQFIENSKNFCKFVFIEHGLSTRRVLLHLIGFILYFIFLYIIFTKYVHGVLVARNLWELFFFVEFIFVYNGIPFFFVTIFYLYKDFYKLKTLQEAADLSLENTWIRFLSKHFFWPPYLVEYKYFDEPLTRFDLVFRSLCMVFLLSLNIFALCIGSSVY